MLTWKVKLSIFHSHFLEETAVYIFLPVLPVMFNVIIFRCSFPKFWICFGLSAAFFLFFSDVILFYLVGYWKKILLIFLSVLRIHDILARIRIRGSMPPSNGSGSCYFRHLPSRCQQKTYFSFSAYFFFRVDLQKEVTKQSESRFCLLYFAWVIEGSRSISLTDPDPGGPKTYGSATLLFIR